MRQKVLILLFALGMMTVKAEMRLPEIMSDGMVLQQQSQVQVWGFTHSDRPVTMTADWLTKPVTAERVNDSLFIARIATPKASYKPHSLIFMQGKERIELSDVLIGEVWFASGQSNMEMPLTGFRNCPINRNNEEIATAGEWAKRIRMAPIPKTGDTEPREEVAGKWQVPSPWTAPWMSATSWFFAKMMNRVLDCPIGIIACAWGGASVEGWSPRDILLGYENVHLEEELKNAWTGTYWEWYAPLVMYNGMLHPLRHYTVKGFIWYQGEANVGKPAYAERLKTMVERWRKEFGDTQNRLPFYQVEIAPWAGYGEGISAAQLRDEQHRAAAIIANSGCICTNDLVVPEERDQIHPAEKELVGYRLAYMALNRTYGFKQIACDAPEYDHHEIHGAEVEVTFKNVEDGLSPWMNIEGFEVAGEDKVFYPAQARIHEPYRTLIVWSEAVPAPKHVRYCYKSFAIGNVRNTRNLPLVPFSSL